MFTGIVEGVGYVEKIGPQTLSVCAPASLGGDGYALGESVAVNGCCLTVVTIGDSLTFDLSPETWRRTSLGGLKERDAVNLERAMPANGRFGGHIVQGHVDATGQIGSMRPEGDFTVLRVAGPAEYDRYLIDKGSIAVDGISLTVVEPAAGAFDVWLVPHTLQNTNLSSRKPGDRVNLEFDLVAKYLEKLAVAR